MAGENLASALDAGSGGAQAWSGLSDRQRQALSAVCDTFVPRLERAEDPDGFFARTATDVGADQGVAQMLATLPDPDRAGLLQLLDALAVQNIAGVSQRSREQLFRNVALASPEAAMGLSALGGMTLLFTYGGVDPSTGQNPFWKTWGYPGPISAPPDVAKTIEPVVPDGDTLVLEADVCVVGSGAGGGVIAGTLAGQGMKVCVLEAGGYYNESDFNQLELWAYQNLYYRGGPTPTAEMSLTMQAGATLGGGTVVNWTNCLRTLPHVREQWAREFGLEGLDTDFDRHLNAVMERISANDHCCDLNGPHQRIREGSDELGWHHHLCVRNTDESTYSPEMAAYMGFGDQTGSKQSTTKTFLQDAFDAGADIVVRCQARRVLVEDGRAVGVEAVYADPDSGRTAQVTVRAPQVVVAGGALESPALLLRSGIGGPAVGRYLRLHPALAVVGLYDEDQRSWWGTPQALVVDEFADLGDGYGFLVEGAQYAPALVGAAVPWVSGEEHKSLLAELRNGATIIALIRDYGSGSVEIDEHGEAVHHYLVSDERDQRTLHKAIEAIARIHEAAGAREIAHLAAGVPRWKRGEESLERFIERACAVPFVPGGQRVFTAHQMGSCRMGTDPAESVADGRGQLHDVQGVWIGDASAFPTPSGTNPMITIMALAHRTAEHIAQAAGVDRDAAARSNGAPAGGNGASAPVTSGAEQR